jgi:glycoside/pentoside/hexuronide:cation symporter, GPH family
MRPISPEDDRRQLRFGFLALLGTGGLAYYYSTYAVQALATPVYQMTLGVNPAWLGLAMSIPRVMDAFLDPIVGNISDNTKSVYGRRRPYIMAGAIMMAAMFGLIWMVPEHWSRTAQLVWFVVTSVLFFVCHSIFNVPLQSLFYEVTPDYDERTRLMGFFTFWNRVGEFSYAWVFPLSRLPIFGSPIVGLRTVAWGVAILFLALPGLIAGFVGRERFAHIAEVQEKVRFWPTIRESFSNRSFRIVVAVTVTMYLVGMVASSMDYYILVYYVSHGNLDEGSYWKGILSSSYGVVGLLSVPLLAALSRRFGKKMTLIGVLCLVMIGASLRWWIFRPGAGWLIIIDPIIGSGALWVAMVMVVQSMFADICDEDELENGQRREGLFGAVFSWLTKAGTSLAFLTTGFVLNYAGFDSSLKSLQAPETILKMRLYLSLAPTLAALACIVIMSRYSISRERATTTRLVLEKRRGVI